MQAEIVREWLTYKEAEQLVGLSRTTLWKVISAGEIEHRKVGRAGRYKSLADEPYETKWIVNPLLVWGRGYIREEGIKDLIKVVRDMQKDFHRVVSIADSELRVSTESEREERRRKRDEEGEDDG